MNPYNYVPIKSFDQIVPLLESAGLPTSDLDTCDLAHFIGCEANNSIVGAVGGETYDNVGLLRSLVVENGHRSTGIGSLLVEKIEEVLHTNGVERVYLLTEHAQIFFENVGYVHISRESAPEEIANTKQFTGICPSSAAFMMKKLG